MASELRPQRCGACVKETAVQGRGSGVKGGRGRGEVGPPAPLPPRWHRGGQRFCSLQYATPVPLPPRIECRRGRERGVWKEQGGRLHAPLPHHPRRHARTHPRSRAGDRPVLIAKRGALPAPSSRRKAAPFSRRQSKFEANQNLK